MLQHSIIRQMVSRHSACPTIVDESQYKYFVVSSDWIIIDCNAPPLYLEYNRCPGDTGSGKLIYSVTYFCGETLDSHSGVLNLQGGITT